MPTGLLGRAGPPHAAPFRTIRPARGRSRQAYGAGARRRVGVCGLPSSHVRRRLGLARGPKCKEGARGQPGVRSAFREGRRGSSAAVRAIRCNSVNHEERPRGGPVIAARATIPQHSFRGHRRLALAVDHTVIAPMGPTAVLSRVFGTPGTHDLSWLCRGRDVPEVRNVESRGRTVLRPVSHADTDGVPGLRARAGDRWHV